MQLLQSSCAQLLAMRRDLVAYGTVSFVAPNTGDFASATVGLARRWKSHGSSPGWTAWRASGAGSRPYVPCDNLASNRTFDASCSGALDGTTHCSADSGEEEIWSWPTVMTASP